MLGRQWRHALLMPARTALDVEAGVKHGSVTPKTNLFLIERDENELGLMKRRVDDLLPWEKPRPTYWSGPVHESVIPEPVDLAWLDLYGNLLPPDCRWVANHLVHNLRPNARVAWTFTASYRGNPVIPPAIKVVIRHRRHPIIRTLWHACLRHQSTVGDTYLMVAQTCLLWSLFNKFWFEWRIFTYEDKTPHVTYVMDNIRPNDQPLLPAGIERDIRMCYQ